jgi:thiamine biosynthesis lipoprotein
VRGTPRGGASGGHRLEVAEDGSRQHALRKCAWAFGTEVSITALAADEQTARAAVEAAFKELELVEQLMSLYRPQSQLCRLNRDKVLDEPHPYLVEVLCAAQAMSRRSRGAFDITVQPLWEPYRTAQAAGKLPDAADVDAAREHVDWRRVEVNRHRAVLHGQGTAITLNGIAQGFAADRVVHALRRHRVEHALIDTGEIGALGLGQDGQEWTIGIQHPRQADAYISLTQLTGRCLATSGDYATTFSDDYQQHHLFDPRTGRSPQALASVSVLASTAMEADALSTAVFVMGPDEGFRLLQATHGADAFLVFKDGKTRKTDGFPLADADEQAA